MVTQLTKPVTRKIDSFVATMTEGGIEFRFYRCRKRVFVPWTKIVQAGMASAANGLQVPLIHECIDLKPELFSNLKAPISGKRKNDARDTEDENRA